MKDGRNKINIVAGNEVEVVKKEDQGTGKLTLGVVKKILTKAPTHPHGIKVLLESGEVGRVKDVLD
ncbi:MAG: YwbE family protein [Cyclobacteriaceae bacterium]|nr:YwbE family protein [Cyclobacteriaceae bacterium]